MLPSEGVHFRVWASRRHQVEVELEGGPGHHPGAESISVALEPAGEMRAWSPIRLHRDLLRLRQTEPVFRSQRRGGMDGAVLGAETFVLRFFRAHGDGRLLVVNLGHALHLNPAPEPLLAPPEGMGWAILLSTEDPRYGGCGTAPLKDEDNWHLPSHAVVVLRPDTRQEREE
jgi:Domain of unknown function (DUF3459)